MKVVLIGDSIRVGYQELVRRKVGSRAEVWSPAENCGHSLMHRENLDRWYLEPQADVIHFNCGIWDCMPSGYDGAARFTVSAYVRNLKLILGRVKAGAPHARLIWATTTPCLSPREGVPAEQCRVHPNVVKYSAAAVQLMRRRGVDVDDLFAAVMAAGVCECLSEDRVHMAPRGNEVLSDAVVRCILG